MDREIRHSVKCKKCGARAGWEGGSWKCNAGHETYVKDNPTKWPRG